MTLKAKLIPNSLTLVFQQESVIYKGSMEPNRTDVAMATPLLLPWEPRLAPVHN